MTTRSGDQQKKQRQKEFKEKKEHQKRLLAEKKANQDKHRNIDAPEEMGETEG
ncbi:MAG: hypothetical protein M3Q05_09385 [Bacteroidota bacterium]|nr:hypothetical protein [Bacteroidota bacterium]